MSSEAEEQSEQPIRYAVRFSTGADQEVTEATARLADITGDKSIAQEWLDSLYDAAATLATNPARFALREGESRMIGEQVRRLLHQRSTGTRSTHAHHLYYTVEDAGDDGPQVTVIHLRHASRKPMTRAEAKDIRRGI